MTVGTRVTYWVERQVSTGSWWRVGYPTSLDGARAYRDLLAKSEPAAKFRIAEVTTVTVIVETLEEQ